jgi:hypothetical protein
MRRAFAERRTSRRGRGASVRIRPSRVGRWWPRRPTHSASAKMDAFTEFLGISMGLPGALGSRGRSSISVILATRSSRELTATSTTDGGGGTEGGAVSGTHSKIWQTKCPPGASSIRTVRKSCWKSTWQLSRTCPRKERALSREKRGSKMRGICLTRIDHSC